MTTAYETSLREYREAIDRLRKPRAGAEAVERGGRGISASAPDADFERVVKSSEDLRAVLSGAGQSEDPDVRDIAGLKMLAAAATDLGVAEQMFRAETEKAGGSERAGDIILTQPELAAILDAPLDARGMAALPKIVVRAALPGLPGPAGQKLVEMAEQLIKNISEKTADCTTTAISGAVAFGTGPLQQWLTTAGQQILAAVPEGLSRLVRYAVRLVLEAVRKLWDLFGKPEQDDIQGKAKEWFKRLLEKADPATVIVDRLYDSDGVKKEVTDTIKNTKTTDMDRFRSTGRQIDSLSDRHAHVMSTLGWIVRGVGWLRAPLMAVTPWGPAAAYAVYGGVLGYAVYIGADYLDAEPFAWLDRVPGLRKVVKKELG